MRWMLSILNHDCITLPAATVFQCRARSLLTGAMLVYSSGHRATAV